MTDTYSCFFQARRIRGYKFSWCCSTCHFADTGDCGWPRAFAQNVGKAMERAEWRLLVNAVQQLLQSMLFSSCYSQYRGQREQAGCFRLPCSVMLTFGEQSYLTWLEILEQLSDTENEVILAKLTEIMCLRVDLYRGQSCLLVNVQQ